MTDDAKKVKEKLERLCVQTEKCKAEALQYLLKWKIEKTEAEKIIHDLVSNKFIDEERYARAFVRDKYRYARWGKNKISQALRFKKVEECIISNALEEHLGNDYMELVKEELMKYAKKMKEMDPWKRKSKLYRFALQRGYDISSIESLLEELTKTYE